MLLYIFNDKCHKLQNKVHFCSIMFEQLVELLLVKIGLASKTLLHRVTPEIINTLIGMISVVSCMFEGNNQ